MIQVRFLQSHSPYHGGETASFPDAVARILIASKIAEEVRAEVEEEVRVMVVGPKEEVEKMKTKAPVDKMIKQAPQQKKPKKNTKR